MYLSRLDLLDVRNVERARLELAPGINLLCGANGSGKTTVLEAVYLLGTGRSFRSNRIGPVVRYDASSLTVFGTVVTAQGTRISLGVQRERGGESLLKVQGERVRAASALAEVLPVQLINPDSVEIVAGAPAHRRRFLDWGTFHVEHAFLDQWKQYRRALEHRNALLRRSARRGAASAAGEFEIWERQLATHAAVVDEHRSGFLQRFEPRFVQMMAALGGPQGVTLGYQRGWDRDTDLLEVLTAAREADREAGFTRAGPQRAELRLTHSGRRAADVLSRGQQKMLSCALLLAQASLVSSLTGRSGVCLLDDMPAELDQEHRQRLAQVLVDMNTQVLVTAVEPELVLPGLESARDLAMFHVEHGRIEAVKTAP